MRFYFGRCGTVAWWACWTWILAGRMSAIKSYLISTDSLRSASPGSELMRSNTCGLVTSVLSMMPSTISTLLPASHQTPDRLSSTRPATLRFCFITPPPVGGRDIVIERFLSLFISLFVSLSATLRENGWTDWHEIFRECVE